MNFISQGDFSFPFHFFLFLAKYIYTWSFQTGAANLDGVLRLPGRSIYFPIFEIFGSLAASYTYLFFSFAIVFVSFFLFLRYFVRVQSLALTIIISLSFTLSPAFLGNTAKIGLVAAAALLPLCILLVYKFFETKNILYLLGLALAINYSLIHPYTFSLNLVGSAAYAMYKLYQVRREWKSFVKPLLLAVVFAIGLNAYCLVTIAGVGSVSKDAISQNATGQETDYFSLVEIANTGDLTTAMSLSKDIFLDFNFHNELTKNLYIASSLLVLCLICFYYFRHFAKLRKTDKRSFALFFLLALGCVLLSTGTMFFVGEIIRVLIALPGGWMFRSPLKWQLYAPVFIWAAFAVLVRAVSLRKHVVILSTILCVIIVLQSGYIISDIYARLLVPRQITSLQSLQQVDLSDKRLLQLAGEGCPRFAESNPRVMTELNQIFLSSMTQVKKTDENAVSMFNISAYDYVLVCSGNDLSVTVPKNTFVRQDSYASGGLVLYRNRAPNKSYFAASRIFHVPEDADMNNIAGFVRERLQTKAHVTTDQGQNDGFISQLYGGITRENISREGLKATIDAGKESVELHYTGKKRLYYQVSSDKIEISEKREPGDISLGKIADIKGAGGKMTVVYRDNTYDFNNSIPNDKFDRGLWQKKVGDCFNFDAKADINMKLNNDSERGKFLTLIAKRHVACTKSNPIRVTPGESYIFTLKTGGGEDMRGGYAIAYDDPNNTVISKQYKLGDASWVDKSIIIKVPEDARHATVYLRAFPVQQGYVSSDVNFDDVSFVKVPDISNDFFVVEGPTDASTDLPKISSTLRSPVKQTIRVTGASEPFYLLQSNSYSKLWELQTVSGKRIEGPQRVDDVNGWYFDPDKYGSDVELVASFKPQKYFYLGLFISTVTLVGCVLISVLKIREHYSQKRSAVYRLNKNGHG